MKEIFWPILFAHIKFITVFGRFELNHDRFQKKNHEIQKQIFLTIFLT